MARTNWVNGEEFDAGDLNTIGADINGRATTSHTHAATSIVSGTLAIARIPTGATSTTVCIGNDARLADTRTPTDNTVTKAKMADDAVGWAELDASGTPTATTFLKVDVGGVLSAADPPAGGGGTGGDLVTDTSPQLGGDLDLNGHLVGAANAADLTKLNAVTATAVQLNRVDATSPIQAQLDAKVPTSRTVNSKALTTNITITGDEVVPTQTGQSGKFLTTNGSVISWGSPAGSGDASTNTATSVDGEVALFSGTAGKTLRRGTGSGIAKLTSGVLGTAISGTDYAPATPGSAVLKGNGTGGFAAAVAGTDYYNPGGTDVAVPDGGTGRSTSTTAYGVIAAGTTATGAQQTISPGTSGQFLKSAGASALAAFAAISTADLSDGANVLHALVWTGSAWPDRPAGWGPTLFIGGSAPANAPADADLANGDLWIPAS